MSKEEWVEVEVLNWSKYNPRGDVKKPSWFRVDYGMLDDPDFYSFTHEEFKAWLYVLAQACRKNTGTIRVNYDHAERVSRLSRKGVDGALKKLESLSIVLVNVTDTSRIRHADVTDTNATERTERTERTRCSSELDSKSKSGSGYGAGFQEVYESYPRREGKSAGFKVYERDIKNAAERDSLLLAIQNYRKSKLGTEARYLLMFSTFMNQWRDWLDPGAGLSRLAAPLHTFDDLVKGLA